MPSRPCLKIAKMVLLTPACNFEFFEPDGFIWRAMKVPLFEFIQKCLRLCSTPSKWLSERINWIISRIPCWISKAQFREQSGSKIDVHIQKMTITKNPSSKLIFLNDKKSGRFK